MQPRRIADFALIALLVAFYACAVGLNLSDKVERVGRPDIGWVMDGPYAMPTRHDAQLAGLIWGSRVLRVNGQVVRGGTEDMTGFVVGTVGATNVVTLEGPLGQVLDVTVTVRPLTWADVWFTEGPTLGLGLVFFAIGLVGFFLRPFAASSWALLAFATSFGAVVATVLLPFPHTTALRACYARLAVGLAAVVPLHVALAFPVVHGLLLRRPLILGWIYGLGLAIAAVQISAWAHNWVGLWRYGGGGLDGTVLLAGVLLLVSRCLLLSVREGDSLVRQRARMMLAGSAGAVPFVLVNFVRNAFGILLFDQRLAYWPLGICVFALGYITVRHDLLNARIAVRRAVIYAGVVTVLSALALLVIAMSSYALAVLLFPLLYVWPEFARRLDARLYPHRTRLPELIRGVGDDLAATDSVDAVLDVVAMAPQRLCGATGGVAFLLAGGAGTEARMRASDPSQALDVQRFSGEALVGLMVTTRAVVSRDRIAIDPLYANIKADCDAVFDRLRADVVLPMLRDNRVIGGVAPGRRTTRDVYESPELGALSTVAQQAVQALARIEATEELRRREVEFADLKRFFPPAIIDQVMARGGAAELPRQRKMVTVLFADLRGFTSFAERVEPEEVMTTLAEYHAAMGRRIAEFAGTLERFAGDGFMVFFNDPVEQTDHVERAARMALAMLTDTRRLRAGWARSGYEIDVGMGLHTGYATCGFIGYEGRRDYAVIGNVTNLAARLSAAAAGGEALITARVRTVLDEQYATAPVGEMTLKGFQQPQQVYRLLPDALPDLPGDAAG
jgi:class 3 adenylate cyclase